MTGRREQWELPGRSLRLVGVAATAGIIFACGSIVLPASAAAGQKIASGCVSCHTDAEKLKVEAAKVPVPAGSALQAGKG